MMFSETVLEIDQAPLAQPATGPKPTTPSFATVDGGAQSPSNQTATVDDLKNDPQIQRIFDRFRQRALRGHVAVRDDGADLEEIDRIFRERGLRHGAWGPLVEEQRGISYQTALRWIRYKHFYDEVTANGDSSILEYFRPSVIFIVTAPSIDKAALEEVLDRARKGQKITCKDAEEIAGRHRSSKEEESASENSSGAAAGDATVGSASDSEAEGAEDSSETVVADGDGETKAEDAKGESEPKDTEESPEEGLTAEGAQDTEDKSEAEGAEDEPQDEDGEGEPEAGDGEDQLEVDDGEDEPDGRLMAAFESAISEAEESFFDMDKQTKQEALERARENHSDFLSEIAALAA